MAVQLQVQWCTKIDFLDRFNWISTGGWSFDVDSSGVYSANANGSGDLKKSGLVESDKKYRISFEIFNLIDGQITFFVGNSSPFFFTANGQYSFIASNIGNNALFKILASSAANYSLRNLQIQEIAYTDLDIFGTQVLMNYQFKDLAQPENIKGNYSKNILIPNTPLNSKFFKYIFNIDEENRFNMAAKCLANLSVNDENFMKGFIKLDNIIHVDDMITYSVIFYGDNLTFFADIGDDATFDDLDFSDLNEILNKTNVANSWTSFPATSDTVYPYIDYGDGGWKLNGEQGSAIDTAGIGLTVGDFYPAIGLDYIMRKIASHKNYSISSALMNSFQYKRIVLPFGQSEGVLNGYTEQARAVYSDNYNDYWANRNILTSSYDNGDGTYPVNIDFKHNEHNSSLFAIDNIISAERPPFSPPSFFFSMQLDTYNRFNNTEAFSGTKGRIPGTYRVPTPGKYKIRLNFRAEFPNDTFVTCKIYAFKINSNDININNGAATWFAISSGEAQLMSTVNTTMGFGDWRESEFDCDSNDLLGIKVVCDKQTQIYLTKNDPDNNNGIQIFKYGFDVGVEVDYNQVKPKDLKLKDFLKSINNIFNLVYISNPDNSKQLFVEPLMDYLNNSGTTLDWTDKYQTQLETKIEMPKDYLNQNMVWKYKDSKTNDYVNSWWNSEKDQIELGHGSKKIRVLNDFVSGTKKIEVIFKPSPMVTPESADWQFSYTSYQRREYPSTPIYSKNTNVGLRLLYYHYATPGGTKKFRFEGLPYNFYPTATHNLNPNNQTDSAYDLNFDFDLYFNNVYQPLGQFRPANTMTQLNSYNLYWREYIEGLISQDSRLVTAWFNLNSSDLQDFTFANKINISGVLYRVHKIHDFNPDDNDVSFTKVELLKLFNQTTALSDFRTSTGVSGGTREDNFGVLDLGLNNRIPINSTGIILGNDSSLTPGQTSMIIGDRSSGGHLVVGDDIQAPSNKSVVIGSSGITINSGITATVIGSKNKIITSDGLYLNGFKIDDNGIISSTEEIEIGGDGSNGVFNPWKFSEYHIVIGGENGEGIYDDNVWEIELG